MTSMHDEVEAVRELLPGYITHRLDETQRARVAAALASHPELAAEHAWLASIRNHMREDVPVMQEDKGLNTLLARIHGEQSGQIVPLRSRWKTWERPALAIAASVMLVQAGIIGTLFHQQSGVGEITPLSGKVLPASGTLIQIIFHENATEAQIRAALTGAQVEFVSGPSALGVYTARVTYGLREVAASKLRASLAVESVTLPKP